MMKSEDGHISSFVALGATVVYKISSTKAGYLISRNTNLVFTRLDFVAAKVFLGLYE